MPPHQIMRRRTDGNQVASEVEAVLRQKRADAGKTMVQVDAFHGTHVQMHHAEFTGAEPMPRVNSARHHIAGASSNSG